MFLFAANLVLILHLLFICIVLFGGFFVLRWPRLAFVHIPAAVWGFLVEACGWYCPLTDLENMLLQRAGETGYSEGFLEYHLHAIIYPEGLTREIQVLLAGLVLTINMAIYGRFLWNRTAKRRKQD